MGYAVVAMMLGVTTLALLMDLDRIRSWRATRAFDATYTRNLEARRRTW